MRQFEREILRDLLLSSVAWLIGLLVLVCIYVLAVSQL